MPFDASPEVNTINKFGYNNVVRDSIQSNLGTNLSANEILQMFVTTASENYESFQLTGGTFLDLFITKGRDEWAENTELLQTFDDVVSSALIRGDFGVGYERNPQDVIDALILELAKRGLNEVTNFHGGNDTRMQEGVFKAVAKARDAGHDIRASKVVCIEDNPNITIESVMKALSLQEDIADSGIYLKNANGKVSPAFMSELVTEIAEQYPGEKITFHTHNNQGLGYATCLASAEAAAEVNAKITFDVLPKPLAEGTAQVDVSRLDNLLKNHPNPKVSERSGHYDESKDAVNYPKMREARFRNRDAETKYSARIFGAFYKSGTAGGAMATLKKTGLLDQLNSLFDTEEDMMVAIADMEEEVKERFGFPVSVTPFQKILTAQAGAEILYRASGYTPYAMLRDESIDYLIGKHGEVSSRVSRPLQRQALEKRGLDEPVEFVPADQLPPMMDKAKSALQSLGFKRPKTTDCVTAAMFAPSAVEALLEGKSIAQNATRKYIDHIMSKYEFSKQNGLMKVFAPVAKIIPQGLKNKWGQNVKSQYPEFSPAQPPEWPKYLQPQGRTSPGAVNAYDVAMALGGAAELERISQAALEAQKLEDSFYKTKVGSGSHFKEKDAESSAEVTEYLEGAYAQWHKDANDEIAAFMRSIPKRLQEAGFSRQQANGTLMNNLIDPILKDVMEAKGLKAGSYPLITDYDLLSEVTTAFANDNEKLESEPVAIPA